MKTDSSMSAHCVQTLCVEAQHLLFSLVSDVVAQEVLKQLESDSRHLTISRVAWLIHSVCLSLRCGAATIARRAMAASHARRVIFGCAA